MKKFRPPKTKEIIMLAEFYKNNYGYSTKEAAESIERSDIIVLQEYISDTSVFTGDIIVVIPPGGPEGTLIFEVHDLGLVQIMEW